MSSSSSSSCCCHRRGKHRHGGVQALAVSTTSPVVHGDDTTIPSLIQASTTTLVTPNGQARVIQDADDLAVQLQQYATLSHVHWIVLVHGWMGNPSEMNTLRTSLVQHAMAKQPKQPQHDAAIVVHCAAANHGRTADGIVAGGTRLAQEILMWLQTTTTSSSSNPNTTLSLIGNSLGGLYARQALNELSILWNNQQDRAKEDDNNQMDPMTCKDDQDDTTSSAMPYVTPLVFGTTATPHLGVGHQHTYLPLPRWAERSIAMVMQQTGADLFRTSHVVDDLTFQPRFVTPLQQFHYRIAYANVQGTDFQVPTATAAFVTPHDTTPGTHTVVVQQDQDKKHTSAQAQIRLMVQTRQHGDNREDKSTTTSDNSTAQATTAQLAQALDRLGWTKVFCDVRRNIPRVPLPTTAWFTSSSNTDNNDNATTRTNYSSADLYHAWATWSREAWHVPVGHTVMVANAKNKLYAAMNAAGKPVMDALAAHVLESISSATSANEQANDDKP